jgi:sec-independent protein translocase protein TatA
MGIGGISVWQLLIVLAIVIMLFGTKRLRNIGGDLGSSVKEFNQALRDGGDQIEPKGQDSVLEGGSVAGDMHGDRTADGHGCP